MSSRGALFSGLTNVAGNEMSLDEVFWLRAQHSGVRIWGGHFMGWFGDGECLNQIQAMDWMSEIISWGGRGGLGLDHATDWFVWSKFDGDLFQTEVLERIPR